MLCIKNEYKKQVTFILKVTCFFCIFFVLYKKKKESDTMIDFEENKRHLQDLQLKLKELGESL